MRTGEMNARPQPGGTSSSLEEPIAVVMDIGGNWIRVALVTRSGELLWRERTPTNAQVGGSVVIAGADEMLHRGLAQVGDRRVSGIGMGLAGPVDPGTGIMYSPPNIPGLDGVSFKTIWKDSVECPILVGNDATLAALGEYTYGGGAGARMLVYITVSTGIGGGVVIDGRPMMGAYGMAGEFGHMCVDRNGPSCPCGSKGCWEAVASGSAIAERARKQVDEKGGSVIASLVSGELDRISAETVFEAAARGDTLAKGILEDVARGLGTGLVNILHIFNPDVIVIGGGVSRNWDYLQPAVQSYIEAHAMSHVHKMGFKLVVSSLGDDVGLLGAAALVWQAFDLQGSG